MPTITDNYFPGVHVAERPFQPGATSTAPVVAFGAFIGKASQGPTAPTEVRSWPQFTTHFGTNYTDLHNSVYDFFANGGRRAYIVRIPGAGGAVASLPIFDSTIAVDPPGGGVTPLFTATSTNPGSWGNTAARRLLRTRRPQLPLRHGTVQAADGDDDVRPAPSATASTSSSSGTTCACCPTTSATSTASSTRRRRHPRRTSASAARATT